MKHLISREKYICEYIRDSKEVENEIKRFKLVMDVVKSHKEYMDSLPSVKPISIK